MSCRAVHLLCTEGVHVSGECIFFKCISVHASTLSFHRCLSVARRLSLGLLAGSHARLNTAGANVCTCLLICVYTYTRMHTRTLPQILGSLKAVVRKGVRLRLLQTTPHLVLLSRSFYNRELRPVLVQWMSMWLSTQPTRGISEQAILQYLLEGKEGRKEGRGRKRKEKYGEGRGRSVWVGESLSSIHHPPFRVGMWSPVCAHPCI